ncbi:MAG: hypothetical protein IK080_06095 [Clostridia bacterium]|nr:hypothetical protein [Clostridia bacterium]
MFYQVTDAVRAVSADALQPGVLTAGFVSVNALQDCAAQFGFSPSTVSACAAASLHFRSGVEIYDDYTFTELRVMRLEDDGDGDDCLALYIKKDLLLVVDVDDRDGSTKAKFEQAVSRLSPSTATLEKLVCCFLDTLVTRDSKHVETVGNEIAAMEERLLDDQADNAFTRSLLALKKQLLTMRNYYEQLLDITEALDENENDLLPDGELMLLNNVTKKVTRLREDVDSLQSAVEHLQDAYSATLDMKLNRTMKVLTVITTIFFPLTIIVGWYGMNFQSMPEFPWKYGYLYVIALSVATVAAMVLLGKKKKWF